MAIMTDETMVEETRQGSSRYNTILLDALIAALSGIRRELDKLEDAISPFGIARPKHYTDAELIQICKDRQAAGMPSDVIRATIYQYAGKDKSVVNIPHNKRGLFVNMLELGNP